MSTRGGPVRRARCVEPPVPTGKTTPGHGWPCPPLGCFIPGASQSVAYARAFVLTAVSTYASASGGSETEPHVTPNASGEAGGSARADRCPVVAEGDHRGTGFVCAKRTPGRGGRPGVGRRWERPVGRGGFRGGDPVVRSGGGGGASRGGHPGQGLGNRWAWAGVRSSAPGSRGGSPPWRRAAAPGWRGGPSSARSGGCRRTCRSTGRCSAAPGRPRRAAGGWGSAGC